MFQTNHVDPGGIGAFDPCVLYLNSGGGTFTAHVQPMTGFYSAAGDLDGNGLPDVVLDGQVWFNAGGDFLRRRPRDHAGDRRARDPRRRRRRTGTSTSSNLRRSSGSTWAGACSRRPSRRLPYSPVNPTNWVPTPSIVADFDRDGGPDVYRVGLPPPHELLPADRPGEARSPGAPRIPRPLRASGRRLRALRLGGNGSALPLPPYGTVLIDPATALLLHTGAFAPAGAPTPGFASLQATLPPQPSLVGLTLYWQMFDSSARLSNRMTTTIAGY